VLRTSFQITLALLMCLPATAQTVRVGIFRLFTPGELIIRPAAGSALMISAEGRTFVVAEGEQARVISHDRLLRLLINGEALRTPSVRASSRDGSAAKVQVEVPGKIVRTFYGVLRARAEMGAVAAVVEMDLETAVASAVAAETEGAMPLEALKAQAVVTRSYYLANRGRHVSFDFCDTTHCQFLREPPASTEAAAIATTATRGLVLTYDGAVLAGMFFRSCSGRTLTLSDIGVPTRHYPFFSVTCEKCRQTPTQWSTRIPGAEAQCLNSRSERARLAAGHEYGWSAVRSNTYTAAVDGDYVLLRGAGEGHGVGLCQRGAAAMAAGGADFRRILAHYFPNTAIAGWN
jgi:stage II sporulation protein D